MKWIKKGLIHAPSKTKWWNLKYNILPVPIYIENDNIIRIFFGTTDKNNFGRISFLDLDAECPSRILYEHDSYVLDVGEDGTFDDCGVVPSCILKVNGTYFLYTVGFQRTIKTPYMLFAGLAKSNNLINFERVSKAPILKRTDNRYISQGAPCVIFENGTYKMWHWYANEWISVDGKQFMDYHIGYAESDNATTWEMHPDPCIWPRKEFGEFAVARPWVFKKNGIYHMYYSTRYQKKLYRIEYATSIDGKEWNRDYEPPFDVSNEGWDSEMICYSSIVSASAKTYMFYNGNNNGASGFGYAELVI